MCEDAYDKVTIAVPSGAGRTGAIPVTSHAAPPGVLIAHMAPPAHLVDEFNRWYDDEHVPQRRVLPGFRAVARYRGATARPDGRHDYLAVYGLDSTAAVHTQEYLGLEIDPTTKSMIEASSPFYRIVASLVAGDEAPLFGSLDLLGLVLFFDASMPPERGRDTEQLADALGQRSSRLHVEESNVALHAIEFHELSVPTSSAITAVAAEFRRSVVAAAATEQQWEGRVTADLFIRINVVSGSEGDHG